MSKTVDFSGSTGQFFSLSQELLIQTVLHSTQHCLRVLSNSPDMFEDRQADRPQDTDTDRFIAFRVIYKCK